MQTKHLIIPVAALALATSVTSVNAKVLRGAGLSKGQVNAFAVARELQQDGKRNQARDVLAEAGIDLDVLEEIRNVMAKETT